VEREDATCTRIGIVVPKKQVKRAVDRNLVKRRVRDVYRKNKHAWPAETDFIVYCTAATLAATYDQLKEEMLFWGTVFAPKNKPKAKGPWKKAAKDKPAWKTMLDKTPEVGLDVRAGGRAGVPAVEGQGEGAPGGTSGDEGSGSDGGGDTQEEIEGNKADIGDNGRGGGGGGAGKGSAGGAEQSAATRSTQTSTQLALDARRNGREGAGKGTAGGARKSDTTRSTQSSTQRALDARRNGRALPPPIAD
jgi:hypothetical protein